MVLMRYIVKGMSCLVAHVEYTFSAATKSFYAFKFKEWTSLLHDERDTRTAHKHKYKQLCPRVVILYFEHEVCHHS